MRKKAGSALVDYALPTALIGLVIGLGLFQTLKGDTLTGFLAASQKMQLNMDTGIASIGESDSSSETNTQPPTNPSPIISTGTIGNTEINYHEDGSSSFFVNSQEVNLSSTTVDNLNEIMETSGTAGLNEYVVDGITKLIEDHKTEYAGTDVPIEYKFGTSDRSDQNQDYYGEAEANIIQMSVGEHMIIINKDQMSEHGCTGAKTDIPPGSGIHVVEGTLAGNTFTGSIIGGEYTGESFNGSYVGDILQGIEIPGEWWNYTFQTTT